MPLPEASAATALGVPLTLRSSSGAGPEYETGSVKETATSIVRPAPYAPPGVAEETPTARGAIPSILIGIDPDSEPGEPGTGRVRSASTPVSASTISPGPYRAYSSSW